MKNLFLFLFVLISVSCSKCSPFPEKTIPEKIKIISFNAENLFDGTSQGTEYPEFDPENGKWDSRDYNAKLLQISRMIENSGKSVPDIIAFQEIENKNILSELIKGYLSKYKYKYIIVSNNKNSAINTGFISRYPCNYKKSHIPYIEPWGKMREITEVSFDIEGLELIIFNNHWKSKTGGKKQTERERMASADTLITRINAVMRKDPEAEILLLGDFNENADEFYREGGKEAKAIMPADEYAESGFQSLKITGDAGNSREGVFFSPWLSETNREEGSYFYKNRWETIDNFFLGINLTDGEGLYFSDFRTVKTSWNTDKNGHPLSFSRYSKKGCSDHFPILLELHISK